VSGVCLSIAVLIGGPASILITSAFVISAAFFASYVALSEDYKPAQVIENTNSSKAGVEGTEIC
ncbi:hypothetical protein, partial [Wolbachia endosymbiont of Atemnus politus]|uniref:hypothetical protein n=1 Tax=Wolbachia endosymbiont of Atemnus politus TaxID=2682840 RepID=UPI001572FEBB